MATSTLYSQEDVNRLLEIKENWVSITESTLPKNTTVWDGTRAAVYKITGWQTAHPELGKVYILRDLHTGVSTPVKMEDVHTNYKKFQLSEEAKRLRDTVRSVQYRVYLIVQGQPYEAPTPPTADRGEAITQADELHMKSGQVYVVRNLKSGDIIHRADAPIPTVPGEAPSTISNENVLAELRSRKTVKLTNQLMKPGIVVKHARADEFFVYDGPNPNDKSRHVFSNLRTGEPVTDVPAMIAESLYEVVVPYSDDLLHLIPWFPREVYGEINRTYGDLYNGATSPPKDPKGETPAPVAAGGAVIDVSGTSRRTVGKDAAERGIQKTGGGEQFAVQYFQKNWMSPRIYEKGYKSEYQATKRAETLFGTPGVVWVSVLDTKDKNKRVFILPPGFDPDNKEADLPPGDSFTIKYLTSAGNWAKYERVYKTYVSAVNRAKKLIEDSKRSIVRAEVTDTQSNRLLHIANLRGIDLKTFGIISPEKIEEVSVVGEEVTTAENGTLRPAPKPTPTPAPISAHTPPKSAEESLRDLDKIIPLRQRPPREGIRDELSLTVSRKLIALACVSVISRYNVSVPDAVLICQENQERLEDIATQLAQNEITLYDAIRMVNDELVKIYDLSDLTVAPAAPPVEAPSGIPAQDIEPLMRHIALSVLKDNTISRVSLASGKAGKFTEGDLHEAAFQVVSGKLKRSKATADLTVYITDPGTATADSLWEDYELGAEKTAGGLVIKFGVRMTTLGYVLQPERGKTYPGRGFFGVIRSMREKYGATIIVQEDKERIDIDQLL